MKPNLLLLHGALGASDQFAPLLPLLEEHYQVHCLDFEGHGRAALRSRPFRIEHFAENAIDYLEQQALCNSLPHLPSRRLASASRTSRRWSWPLSGVT